MSTQQSDVDWKPQNLDHVRMTTLAGFVVVGIVSEITDTKITVCEIVGDQRNYYDGGLTGRYAVKVERL